MKVIRIKPSPCPYCGYSLSAASNPLDQIPLPGDLTMCANCRNLLEFDEDMKPIKTNQDLKVIDKEDRIEFRKFIEKYFND